MDSYTKKLAVSAAGMGRVLRRGLAMLTDEVGDLSIHHDVPEAKRVELEKLHATLADADTSIEHCIRFLEKLAE